jgi:HPt (histidine-containing phosphotransfer) domain-containing protein
VEATDEAGSGPEPESTREPAAESMPEPAPETAPETAPEPMPEPAPEPALEAVAEPAPEVVVESSAPAPAGVEPAAESTEERPSPPPAGAWSAAATTTVALPAPGPELELAGPVFDVGRLETSSMGNAEVRVMIVRTFLGSLEKTVQKLRAALETGDAGQVEFQAHSLKGMSGSVGAARCEVLFGEIERCGREGVPTEAWPLLYRATFELARAEVALRAELPASEEKAA